MRAITRPIGIVAVALVVGFASAACVPEPTATSTPTATPTPVPTVTSTTSPDPSPTADTGLPAACEDAYTAEMLAQLEATLPPLNDPGITMLSTQNADLLDLIDAAQSTLRCTWGPPSEHGIATNITAIGQTQGAAILASLQGTGFGCETLAGGTVCRIEQRGVTQDDVEYSRGEIHYIGEDGWIATAWLNVDTAGYIEDMVTAIWG